MNLAQIMTALEPLNPTLCNQHLIRDSFQAGIGSGFPRVDNRFIERGDVFICIKGLSSNAHDFAHDAWQKGAALLIVEEERDYKAAYIKVDETRKAAALMAKLYYGDPSASLVLIGITGTNGKTTSSLLIYEALRMLGYKAAWIGTLGYYIDGELNATNHTTPDILQLNEILAVMRDKGVSHVVMEVSSHAIALDRIYGLTFDYCLFSNLSREHLDFHKTMEEYGEVKFSFLRRYLGLGSKIIINTDDNFGRQAWERLQFPQHSALSVGTHNNDYTIQDLSVSSSGSKFKLAHRNGVLAVDSSLIGFFNVDNIALAVSCLLEMGFKSPDIEAVIPELKSIKGRFESVPNTKGISVFVDYAHSPDAIENILKSCIKLKPSRLLCLVGAGGDRDKGKRPLMLQAALHNSDIVIITDDNPRTENPEQIIIDMLSGTDMWFPWWIIRDRKSAIESILRLANPGDIVVLCGKGHEDYQEINGARHHFNDYEVAFSFLNMPRPTEKADDEVVLSIDRLLIKLLINPLYDTKEQGYKAIQEYRFLSSDSRTLNSGSCYFALQGERFDGNQYVEQVCADPKNLAIGSRDYFSDGKPENYERVSDPERLMGDLARKYLMMFPAYKVALTGSTGKSSTKEYMAAILAESGRTLKTRENENNQIGLVKTILRILPEDQYAVLEIGTNHFGEIQRLAEIAMPDSAMILNVGPSHLEHLIDEDGVYKEKISLFNRTLQYRLFPADDQRFIAWADIGLSVGFNEQSDHRISDINKKNEMIEFKLNNHLYSVPGNVSHNVINSSFAIAMATCLGLEQDLIQQGLNKVQNLKQRLELKRFAEGLIIVDCYNANPVSMQKAIEFWLSTEPEKKHKAILGDMLELGENSALYHQMIGAILSESNIKSLITVGDMSTHYKPDNFALEYCHYEDVAELIPSLDLGSFCQGAVVLIKASHGIHLEKLLPDFGDYR